MWLPTGLIRQGVGFHCLHFVAKHKLCLQESKKIPTAIVIFPMTNQVHSLRTSPVDVPSLYLRIFPLQRTTLISLYPILCSPEALLEHRISPGIGELQSLVPTRYSLHGSATVQRDVLDLLEMQGCVQASVSPDRVKPCSDVESDFQPLIA